MSETFTFRTTVYIILRTNESFHGEDGQTRNICFDLVLKTNL